MKLKIDYKPGNRGHNPEKDRQIYIKTENHCKEGEKASMFKLGLLINQFAVNELAIWNYNFEKLKGKRTKEGVDFFFKRFIIQAITDAEHGIDWADKHQKHHVKKICERYDIKPETINPLLHRTQTNKQAILKEFNHDWRP